MTGWGCPALVPGRNPVVRADGEPVGHAAATGPDGLRVEEAAITGDDTSHVRLPRETIAGVGERGVVLATTGVDAAAAERERAELVALLRRAHTTNRRRVKPLVTDGCGR